MVTVLSTVILFFIFLELFLTFLVKRKKLFTKEDLFPDIPQNLVEKFNTFDSELGWVNKANTIKYDSVGSKTVQYTFDENGSRIVLCGEGKPLISSYGDSFCQCREVNDNETWQYYLSEITGKKVQNFGVGNYGIDQALLRLEREYDKNPTPIVILNFVPEQIKRITSVWKWISELTNILNFKPRFYADGTYIKNLNTDLNELKNYKLKKEDILKNDEHLEYITSKLIFRPYSISIFLKPRILAFRIILPIVKIMNKYINVNKLYKYLIVKNHISEVKYMDYCWEKQNKVFEYLMKRFYAYSVEKNFKPVVLITPQNQERFYMKYKKGGGKYYQDYLNLIPKEIMCIDFGEDLYSLSDKEQNLLYVYEDIGGHHSKFANQQIAIKIKERIKI